MTDDLKAELLEFALGLPEAWEDHPWGESVAKVGKKVFVFFGDDASERARSFTVKLRESHDEASAMGWTADPGYGLGRGGWLTVTAPDGRADGPPRGVDRRELSCRGAKTIGRGGSRTRIVVLLRSVAERSFMPNGALNGVQPCRGLNR